MRWIAIIAVVSAASPAAAGELSPEVRQGLELLGDKGCTACHTTDGRRQVGPTFLGAFGTEIAVVSGGTERTVVVDAEYVRRSVLAPNAEVRAGYAINTMPAVEVSGEQLELMVAALEHLGAPDVVAERKKAEGSPAWIVIAVLAFVLGHLVLSSRPVRARLIARLTTGGYMLAYAAYASLTLGCVIWAYVVAPYVPLWTPPLWTRWLPLVGMPIASILMVGSFVPTGTANGGVKAITRHPQLWAQGIWGLCHLPPNGDLATVTLFGGLAALSFAGMIHIELRKRVEPDDAWRALVANTSVVPFAAVASGRTRLSARDLALPVAAGLAAFGTILFVHEALIGQSPFPY